MPIYSGHMPTIPPPSGSRSRPEPHRHRQVAESFGGDAERYDRTRPRYPDAMVERIVAASPGPDVLDVGCGTGIEARQFQAAGCNYVVFNAIGAPEAEPEQLERIAGLGFAGGNIDRRLGAVVNRLPVFLMIVVQRLGVDR